MIDPIRRAERAVRILEDDLVREARQHMHDSLTRSLWRREELTPAAQMKLDAYVRHFDEFFAWFHRAIDAGKVAEADLQDKSRLRKVAERVAKQY
jgi:hypothetical protein